MKWYIDGPNIHGEAGLASIGRADESDLSDGPDKEFEGTISELLTYLRDEGFEEIETADKKLASAAAKAGFNVCR